MNIYSTYKVKIKHYNNIFKKTVDIYRSATDYLIQLTGTTTYTSNFPHHQHCSYETSKRISGK